MCSRRSQFLFVASAFTIFLGPSVTNAQVVKSSYETSLSDSDIFLRRVVVKHPGCITCNATILNAEKEYLRKRVDGGGVFFPFDPHYEQKKVSDVKKALEGFWKERGIAVEVSTNLTQATNARPYTVLEFDVYGKY
jgi:hypothetical protein